MAVPESAQQLLNRVSESPVLQAETTTGPCRRLTELGLAK
jgi:hypothetical protein